MIGPLKVPTAAEIESLIKEKTGRDASVIEPNPVIVGPPVSLASFGMIGWAVLFQNSQGELKACLVPFGLDSHLEVPEAA